MTDSIEQNTVIWFQEKRIPRVGIGNPGHRGSDYILVRLVCTSNTPVILSFDIMTSDYDYYLFFVPCAFCRLFETIKSEQNNARTVKRLLKRTVWEGYGKTEGYGHSSVLLNSERTWNKHRHTVQNNNACIFSCTEHSNMKITASPSVHCRLSLPYLLRFCSISHFSSTVQKTIFFV